MDIHAKAFKEEAYEILTELESLLLELAENNEDGDLIDRVFGSFHTIKGSGSMFGFDAIAEFTHEIETALDHVREGIISVTPELISLTLEARDKILELLDKDTNILDDEAQKIISAFQEFVDSEQMLEDDQKKDAGEVRSTVTYRIRFKPEEDIFTSGTNPLLLLAELKEMGDCSIVAKSEGIPELAGYGAEKCYVSWDIILTTDKDENLIHDVFVFVADQSEISIKPVYEHFDSGEPEDYNKLGEILLDRGDISKEELKRIIESQKKIGEKLVESEIISAENIEAALTEQEHVRKMLRSEREKNLTSIRVDASRIDNLVDLVGELVTAQARLSQKASGDNDPELQAIAESVERLTEELRDNAMSIRMVPIGTIFSRMRRLVHDLSEDLGKQVTMTTKGAATELDKTVIDKLNETLIHIIRNAIDHGIELPATREALNKQAKGTVHLAAYHEGASVIIKISDDGAGLDPEKLKALAAEKGLVASDAELSKEECFGLIHHPGFTTTDEANSVSGRGVGMDVVKRSIENLRGTINIDSTVNAGTTISLRLPLTLAIIDGLLVRIGSELFVFPLTVVDECVELSHDEAELARERSMMTFRGEAFAYISLRQILEIEGDHPNVEKIILVKVGGKRIGFSVDQVIGQHQTVIKSLSQAYGNIGGISGATILGDGTVALILDVNQLIVARRNESVQSQPKVVEHVC